MFAVKSSGGDFPGALGTVLPPLICAPADSLVRSGAGFPSAGEITDTLEVTRSNLTCQYSCPIPVWVVLVISEASKVSVFAIVTVMKMACQYSCSFPVQ